MALGKRVGLSFQEINDLTASELIEFAKFYSGSEDEETREADQDDIDAFYGR